MAIANGYATLAEFKAWRTVESTDATDDGVIEQCIEAASRYIDNETGRTFYARSETRYYDAVGGRRLKLDDDLLAITTLTNGDDVAIADTEYNLWPKNNAPYSEIRLKASSSTLWVMDSDGNSEAVISIAGTWGYLAAAPHDIRQVCLMIAHNMDARRTGENVSSTVKVTAFGVVVTPTDIPGIAAQVFRKYKRLI